MSDDTIENRINNHLNKFGGLFVNLLHIDTKLLYSEDFLRKWARANNVGKLGKSYFFKKADIEKFKQDTENFTTPQNKITIDFKVEKLSFEKSKKLLNQKLQDIMERSSDMRERELLNKFKLLPDENEDSFRIKEDLFSNGNFTSKDFLKDEDDAKFYLSKYKLITCKEIDELYNIQLQKQEIKYVKTTINPYILEEPQNINISKEELRKKNILSSYEVAYITNYSVQTINRWAQHYCLPKDSFGYRWTPADLKRFEIRKFFDKDSYHVHINKTLYGKSNMSLRGWISLAELAILLFIILIFCCSI